jgi:hypothetical protein
VKGRAHRIGHGMLLTRREVVQTVVMNTIVHKKILIYKEIQMGAVAKSYMRKSFLMYEEMRTYLFIYMRRPLVIYDFATLLDFLIYKKIMFSVYQCVF